MYTNGQRQGFTITTANSKREPYYVCNRNIQKNTITVSTVMTHTKKESLLTLCDMNYIAWKPEVGSTIEAQTRYRQKPALCTISRIEKNTLTLTYTEEGEVASVGQSCVLYDGMTCCGGGIIV